MNQKKPNKKMICLSINMEKTGKNIRQKISDKGYSVRDVMDLTGISTEQAVYKWLGGRSLPTLETLLILGRILNSDISELLILDEVTEKKCEDTAK